jgi:hypothetical protein
MSGAPGISRFSSDIPPKDAQPVKQEPETARVRFRAMEVYCGRVIRAIPTALV